MNDEVNFISKSKPWLKQLFWLALGLSIGLSLGQFQVRAERESTLAYMKIANEMTELLGQCVKGKSP